MGKPYFVFMDRVVPVEFFEEEPVQLTLLISDKTDKKISDCAQRFLKADEKPVEKRLQLYETALADFIGEEKADAILTRTEARDCFAVYEVFCYILNTYKDAKTKKLAGFGR